MQKSKVDIKELAKGMVASCIRNNTCLEDYHSELTPIGDREMKKLMIDCVDNIYTVLLSLMSEDPKIREIAEKFLKENSRIFAKHWDEPKISKRLTTPV